MKRIEFNEVLDGTSVYDVLQLLSSESNKDAFIAFAAILKMFKDKSFTDLDDWECFLSESLAPLREHES